MLFRAAGSSGTSGGINRQTSTETSQERITGSKVRHRLTMWHRGNDCDDPNESVHHPPHGEILRRLGEEQTGIAASHQRKRQRGKEK